MDPIQCNLLLAGLGVAFRELLKISQEKAFAAGQAACGQLGLRLEDVDATSRHYFKNYVAAGRGNGISELTPEQAVDALRKAVILGANEAEPDNDLVFFEKLLGDPDGYRDTSLLRAVGGTKQAPRALERAKDKPVPRK